MQTLIPVICNTQSCGTIWFSTSIFGIGPGASITATGNKVSPCPNCEGVGHIPDGVYTHSSASLFNPLECNLILNALEILRQKAISGSSAEQIKEDIEKQFPFLNGFSKFLPKNAGELAAYLAILVTLFMSYANKKPDEQAPSVHVQVNISQALEQVSASLKNNQQSNQEPQRTIEQEKTEKE